MRLINSKLYPNVKIQVFFNNTTDHIGFLLNDKHDVLLSFIHFAKHYPNIKTEADLLILLENKINDYIKNNSVQLKKENII